MNQETSQITLTEHAAIHAEIAAILIALEGAEACASNVVRRHRTPDILRIAQTEAGRQSIATALDEVYHWGGWSGRGRRPIEQVFESERGPFVLGQKTSLPWCTRDGAP